MRTRLYDGEQLRRLQFLNDAYAQEFSSAQIEAILKEPARLENVGASALANAALELANVALRGEIQRLADRAAQLGCQILDAEVCFLFLESETRVGQMDLTAQWKWDKRSDRFTQLDIGRRSRLDYSSAVVNGSPPVSIPPPIAQNADSVQSGPSTKVFRRCRQPIEITNRKVTNLFESELARYEPSHLSGRCYSWIRIPIFDRKNRPLGFVVAENRLANQGIPNEVTSFDTRIERLGEAYASLLSGMLELIPHVIALQRLAVPFQKRASIRGYFREVLRVALFMARGYRGEATLVDLSNANGRTGLSIVSRLGPSQDGITWRSIPSVNSPKTSHSASQFPRRSITQEVFERNEAQLVRDVLKAPVYHPCNEATRSQLTVPIRDPLSGQAIGTINVESHIVGGFDETDRQSLTDLAHHAGLFASMAMARDSVIDLFRSSVPEFHKDGSLQLLLDTVTAATGYRGLIYVADYRAAMLRISAKSPDLEISEEDERLLHPFNAQALATKVFFDREPYFATDPTNDLWVCPIGYRAIGSPKGPLLGIPVTFGQIVVGALVLWGTHGHVPVAVDAERLRPLVTLVVSTESSARQARIHDMIRLGKPLDEIMAAALEELCRVADRSRLMQFVSSDTVECLGSRALQYEQNDRYRGRTVPTQASKFFDAFKGASPCRAVHQDPRLLGPDPLAHNWDRPSDLDFYMLPLYVIQNEDQSSKPFALWGYASVDNVYTRRPIKTVFVEEALEQIGSLLELALAHSALRPR